MTDYAALLRELAIPRLVGTANHAQVRAILKRELHARGCRVEEHAFSGRPAPALLGAPRLIHGVNLIGRRASARPAVWLVAHYDSKGQPISMALRLIGAIAVAAGILTLVVQPILGAVVAAGGLLVLSRNRVTDASPGAVDNASAVITVLMTLDRLPARSAVGVIFPDAEEFGLVGARALAREHPDLLAGSAVVNLDGVDDSGGALAFLHKPGKVGAAVASALGARRARWLPIVVDGVALRAASGECVTILKGNWHTARIVHTPRDSAARLSLTGACQVAEGLARALSAP